MTLVDSNIVIYAAREGEEALQDWLTRFPLAVCAISLVEVLGYHRLSVSDQRFLERFFADTTVLAITDAILRKAIALRQARKMGLGDALIAATALIHHLPLATRNTKDFVAVEGLRLLDPWL